MKKRFDPRRKGGNTSVRSELIKDAVSYMYLRNISPRESIEVVLSACMVGSSMSMYYKSLNPLGVKRLENAVASAYAKEIGGDL